MARRIATRSELRKTSGSIAVLRVEAIEDARARDLLAGLLLLMLGALLIVPELLALAVEMDLLGRGRCSVVVTDAAVSAEPLDTATFRRRMEAMCRTRRCMHERLAQWHWQGASTSGTGSDSPVQTSRRRLPHALCCPARHCQQRPSLSPSCSRRGEEQMTGAFVIQTKTVCRGGLV